MSEHETPECIADIRDDGSLSVPPAYLRALGLVPGTRVSVRVTEQVISDGLRQKGVSDEEVEQIGSVQREPRENVLAFLAAEGALRGDTRASRRISRSLRSGR